MIWHIFKKDWNLQWRLVLGAALLQVLLSAMLWRMDSAPGASTIRLTGLVFLAVFLTRAFLIVETVQSDPLPGVRQDWLVRPVRRRDLLIAKLLFTVIVVQIPVVVTDLIGAVADGNSFGSSLSASLTRSIFVVIVFNLPVFAIASITKNLLEVLSSVVFSLVALVLFNITVNDSAPPPPRLSSTALGWEIITLCAIVSLLLAAAILTIQYRRRLTVPSRWLAVTAVAILLGISLLPWQRTAFALQSGLSPRPGAAHAVELAFDANAGPLPPNLPHFGVNTKTNLRIPLSVTGMPADSVLAEEHYDLRLTDSQGVTRASGQSPEYGYALLLIAREGEGQPASVNTRIANYMDVAIDTSDYIRLKDQKLNVEIDYSLTLLKLTESYAMPAVNGTARLPGIGACETHVNELGSSIRWGCSQAGQSADCYSLFILNPSTGRSNEEDWHCGNRDYSPFFTQFLGNAESGPSVDDISFHDPKGQTHYAVDTPDIATAKLVIRNYRRLEHFTRHVTVPARTLSDWLEK